MLAYVNVEEASENLVSNTKRYLQENKTAIVVVGVMIATLLVNRRMLRRELRRINFSIELGPDFAEGVDDEGYLGG